MVMRYLGGVNSPSYNPLAANVTTGTTVVQDGGVYTVSSAAQANGNTQWVNDPFFSSDTILLQADNFANASQNNTFLDSSQNNFTVTRNGNATQGAFNPVATPNGYWANNFDGTGDYLTVTGSSNLAFGTGDFTIEFFVNFTSIATSQNIYDARPAATNGAYPVIYFFNTPAKIAYYVNTADRILSNNALVASQWYHVAISRVSSVTRMFINGALQTQTYSDTTNYLNGTTRPIIAASADLISPVLGYVSNLRVLKGTGLYTTSFTPPIEPLTAVTNTQLLTCQNNRFIDNSANNFTITKAGDAAVIPSSPFRTSGPGQYPAIQWGASMSFNGTTQYLTVAGNSNLAFGTGDFTIEMFVYLTGRNTGGAYGTLYSSNDASTFGNYPDLYMQPPTGGVTPYALVWFLNTTEVIRGTTPLNTGTWYHVVASRVSGNTRLFLNGVQEGSTYVDSTNYINGTGRPFIAANAYNSITNISGFISNLRVLKGTGVTSVTVPTAPLTAITNTQLLTCQGSAVDSSTNNFTITNGTGVTASTLGPFTIPGSTGSMYFDGTGDYLTLTGSSNLAFGTGDFTIELFVYFNSVTTEQTLYDGRAVSTGSGPQPAIILNGTSTDKLSYYVNGANRILSDSALTAGQWYHIAISRVSSVTRMFINGVTQTQTYADTTVYTNPASRPIIGAYADVSNAGFMVGFISNLRVLKGTGFTSVTVPTAPLTAITNTQLLLNGTNAGIYDASARAVGETVGNAQVSTAIKKYGSGSMAFDGTGDWLLVPNSSDLNLGTGDFTIECWLNMANTTAARSLIGKGASTTGWGIYFNATPTLFIFEAASTLVYSANYNLIQGQWYHLAVVRSGLGNNNLRMYINGFLVYEATVTTDLTTTANMYVGASRTGTQSMFGYVDDLRISKFARYTGQFIPPAVAMQDQG